MSVDASIPKALYQANVALALRLATLLQENGAQWFDLFAAEANERVLEARAQREATESDTPSHTPALPTPEQMLRWMQGQPNRWQSLLSQAAGHQLRFIEGVQSALQQWQSDCAAALALAGSGPWGAEMPKALMSLGGMGEMTTSMQEFMARFVPAFQAHGSHLHGARDRVTTPAKPASQVSEPTATKAPTPKPSKSASKPKPRTAGKATASKAGLGAAESPPSQVSKPRPVPGTVTRSRRSKTP